MATSSQSPIALCNQSLLAIGAQAQISSFDEGSTEANACAQIYTTQMTALFSSAHWNFARRQLILTQLKAAFINGSPSTNPPPTGWAYEYAYPGDCVQIRWLFSTPLQQNQSNPGSTVGIAGCAALGPQQFQVGLDLDEQQNKIRVILTNAPMAQVVMTEYLEDVSLWDSSFYQAAVATMAAFLVNPLGRNRALFADQVKIASQIIQQARVSDGNEGFTDQDHLPDWMQVRNQGWNWRSDALYFGGWNAMNFPSGFVV